MATEKHTSGPWQSQHDFDLSGEMTILGNVDCDFDEDGPRHSYTQVAEVEQLDDLEETRANAKLIIAAPELLAALKRAEQFIVNGVALGFIRMPDASTPDSAHDTLPAIRAAIAKAGAQ